MARKVEITSGGFHSTGWIGSDILSTLSVGKSDGASVRVLLSPVAIARLVSQLKTCPNARIVRKTGKKSYGARTDRVSDSLTQRRLGGVFAVRQALRRNCRNGVDE